MIFALDIDGVVADIKPDIVNYLIHKGYKPIGTKHRLELQGIEDSKDIINEAIENVLSNKINEIKPYEDAVYFIPELDKLGLMTFVTARHENHNEGTINWLTTNFDVSFRLANRSSKDKPKFISDNKFDFFVEDRLRTANAAAELGIKVFLVNREWNLNRPTHKNVSRVKGLGTVFSLATVMK